METVEVKSKFWSGKRVLVTGHTGFKGAWLTLWLRELGAEVRGIALEPCPSPGLLTAFELEPDIDHCIQDIREATAFASLVTEFSPEIVFHLAAQPLVRRSYQEPLETWTTNVFGTIQLMEALRAMKSSVVAVMVTTDKVYRNLEWPYSYREEDSLGGHDPYSASKAAMELAVASWRASYFSGDSKVAIATARAGNVIGGGDYAADRIVPDMVRSLSAGEPVLVRNPNSTRPWQHVLEPLSGYLTLAERLQAAVDRGSIEVLQPLCSAWNFGPLPEANRTVEQLVNEVLLHWKGTWQDGSDGNAPHEAGFLGLSIDRAVRDLDWYPRWSFDEAIEHTITWYRKVAEGGSARSVALSQINAYEG